MQFAANGRAVNRLVAFEARSLPAAALGAALWLVSLG